jgi:hypothetical protein
MVITAPSLVEFNLKAILLQLAKIGGDPAE